MAKKPSYVGLLNAIAVGEQHGYDFLDCWANTTKDESLAEVLNFVAIRELEHCAAFTKRLCELGFNVREAPEGSFDNRMALAACRKTTDKKKFRKLLGISKKAAQGPDPFGSLFDDTTIDPQTGALLGRYVAEERDSGRRLRAAYDQLTGEAPAQQQADLEAIRQRLEALTDTVESLTRAG